MERRRWLSERRFLHALNDGMLLTGPEATQLATYLGWLMHGTAGGLIAGGLFLLTAVLMLLALASAYPLWGQLPLLRALFAVLQPTVLAIVLQAAWRLGQRTLHTPFLVAIAAAAFARTEPAAAALSPAGRAGGLRRLSWAAGTRRAPCRWLWRQRWW